VAPPTGGWSSGGHELRAGFGVPFGFGGLYKDSMRILVVEDSERLRRSLKTALRHSGYAVDATGDGAEGLWLAEGNDYDVIVLDLMLPGLDGLSLLRKLRGKGGTAHVLVLTARDTVDDRVLGLRTGADDYLVKPFALEELLARVEALCRRNYGHKQPKLALADLEIDLARRTASRAGQLLDLTPREFRLLEFLALRRGEVVSRSEIEEHLYDEAIDPLSNVVDSAICTLRKKLGGTDAAPLIHTRRGAGYLLETG
jgi:DNA-binding response OmpR family regulator